MRAVQVPADVVAEQLARRGFRIWSRRIIPDCSVNWRGTALPAAPWLPSQTTMSLNAVHPRPQDAPHLPQSPFRV